MNKEQATIELNKILAYKWGENGDAETWHAEADEVLCKFLEELGHKDLVNLYKEVPKWYA